MNKYSKQSGYSLVELLVVVSIMILLIGAGSSIYSQTRHIEEINNGANDIQGLIYEAKSMAESSMDQGTLGYQLEIDQDSKEIVLSRIIYLGSDINNLVPGEVEVGEYSLEEVKTVQFSDNILFTGMDIYNNSGNKLEELSSLSALTKSSKLVFNGGVEPDLGQESNLYSPFSIDPDSNGASIAQIDLEYRDQEKNFAKTVRIYLKTGQVEIN